MDGGHCLADIYEPNFLLPPEDIVPGPEGVNDETF